MYEDDNDDDDDDQLMKKKLSVKSVPRRRTLLRTPEGSHQTATQLLQQCKSVKIQYDLSQELDSCEKIFEFDIRCASAHISV